MACPFACRYAVHGEQEAAPHSAATQTKVCGGTHFGVRRAGTGQRASKRVHDGPLPEDSPGRVETSATNM